MSVEEFTVRLERRGLVQTDVFVDGDKVGEAIRMPQARAPKVWLPILVVGDSAETLRVMYTTDTDAAMHVIRVHRDRQKAARIAAKLKDLG